MSALVIGLFVAVAVLVMASLAITIRQFGRRALAIRSQLLACTEARPVRVTIRVRPVRRHAGITLRRASLMSRGVSQSISLAATRIACEMRQVARLSYDPGFAAPRLRHA